ncbi:hypothetical protein HDV00_005084 [Rhizophlyctis rosea]|nr:hypothetical protein HDV00_005084 [Rhizophlyctis rosea]
MPNIILCWGQSDCAKFKSGSNKPTGLAVERALVQAFVGLLFATAESYAHIRAHYKNNRLREVSDAYLNRSFLYGAIVDTHAAMFLVTGSRLIQFYRDLRADRPPSVFKATELIIPGSQTLSSATSCWISPASQRPDFHLWDLRNDAHQTIMHSLLEHFSAAHHDFSALKDEGWSKKFESLGVLSEETVLQLEMIPMGVDSIGSVAEKKGHLAFEEVKGLDPSVELLETEVVQQEALQAAS